MGVALGPPDIAEAIRKMTELGAVDPQHAAELYRVMSQRPAPPPSPPPRLTYHASARPLETKVNAALADVCRQLPVRLASRIKEIRFGPQGVIDPMFEVEFMGGKVISFDNVDEFPTAADVARIALECP